MRVQDFACRVPGEARGSSPGSKKSRFGDAVVLARYCPWAGGRGVRRRSE